MPHTQQITDSQVKQILQELFDKAMIGWANQDWQISTTKIDEMSRIICAYRGDNNTKCLVGHLIPDDKYTLELEGYITDKVIKTITDVSENTSTYYIIKSFLANLQCIHDEAFRSYDGETIKYKLADFLCCYENCLTVPDVVKESFKKKFNMALTD